MGRPRADTPPVSEATREFGRRIKAKRNELGLSQEGLARESSLHWTYVGQMERGRVNPTLHSILRIAQSLGVEAGLLVDGLPVPPRES